jgi:hypothetical protein
MTAVKDDHAVRRAQEDCQYDGSGLPHIPRYVKAASQNTLARKRDGQSSEGSGHLRLAVQRGVGEGGGFVQAPVVAVGRPWRHDLVAILDATATGTWQRAS